MGYRDDLIRRYRESGEWEMMTTEFRTIIEGCTDEMACRLMVAMDEEGIKDAILMSDFSPTAPPEVRQAAAMKCASEGATNLLELFKGKLLEHSPGHVCLSPLGRALADFLKCAKDAGFGLVDSINYLAMIKVNGAVMISMLSERQG